jgi:hypothetical protein
MMLDPAHIQARSAGEPRLRFGDQIDAVLLDGKGPVAFPRHGVLQRAFHLPTPSRIQYLNPDIKI